MKKAEQRLDDHATGVQTLAMPLALLAQLEGVWMERHRAPVARPVLLTFDLTDPLGAELADVFEIPPDDATRVVMVAPAHVVRWMLALIEPDLVDEVRPGRDGPALVVTLGIDCTGVMSLEALREAVSARRMLIEEDPMVSKTSPVVQAVREEIPAKPKRKKKIPKRVRFGEGQYGFSSKIPVERSRQQIEALLQRYACTRFGWVTDSITSVTTIQFECRGRMIRFQLTLPRPEAFEGMERVFKTGMRKVPINRVKIRHERAIRARWRAIAQGIKAKLIMVDYAIESFEEAFLASTVEPCSGRTIGELVREGQLLPQLAAAPRASSLNGVSHVEATA